MVFPLEVPPVHDYVLSPASSPLAESDDLRGDPALGHPSASAPQDARNSIVDAGAVESITPCPPKLPQMMAAGKRWWPVQNTNKALCVLVESSPAMKTHTEPGAWAPPKKPSCETGKRQRALSQI